MFLLFLAQIPLAALWFSRPILRHCNLQTLAVAAVVFLLLLVPLFFPSNAEPLTANDAMPESNYGNPTGSYEPIHLSSFGH